MSETSGTSGAQPPRGTGGAFRIAGDVTWGNTFTGDDLGTDSGAPADRSATSPHQAQPEADALAPEGRAPAATPKAPHAVPVAKSVPLARPVPVAKPVQKRPLGVPAPQQRLAPPPAAPRAPAAPPAPTPAATPASTPVAAPVAQPAAVVAPQTSSAPSQENVEAVPAQTFLPLPTHEPVAVVSDPPPAPIAYEPVALPATPPAAAALVSDDPRGDTAGADSDRRGEAVHTEVPAASTPRARRGGRDASADTRQGAAAKKGKGKAATSPPARKGSSSMAGGRWRAKILRIGIYALLGMLILSGARNSFLPRETPDAATLATQVATTLGENGFPTAAGQAYALRFAGLYLAFDPAKRQERADALATYSEGASQGAFGLSASESTQTVTGGPYAATKPELLDKHNAIYTVAAQVNGTAWMYLAIPVYADNAGRLVISGPPAFVAPPAAATSPGLPGISQPDTQLGSTIAKDVLTGYFTAWAASDATSLARYTTADATEAARTGLGGTLVLKDVGVVTLPLAESTTRTGTVQVTWEAPGVGFYNQTYRITIVQDPADQRWSVQDIKGGEVSADGAEAEGSTAASTPSTGTPASPVASPVASAGE